jgi:hypothetical protein
LGKDMKRSLKISAIGMFLTVFVFGLALPGLWISSLRTPQLMSFDFLNDRAITTSIEYDSCESPFPITGALGFPISPFYSWIQYYSFEADFSDVCKAADAEFFALGFKAVTLSMGTCKLRLYTFSKAASGKTVVIYEKRRFVESPSAQLVQPVVADGWVTVRTERWRIPLWPPRYLLYRLKRLLQAASRQMFN